MAALSNPAISTPACPVEKRVANMTCLEFFKQLGRTIVIYGEPALLTYFSACAGRRSKANVWHMRLLQRHPLSVDGRSG